MLFTCVLLPANTLPLDEMIAPRTLLMTGVSRNSARLLCDVMMYIISDVYVYSDKYGKQFRQTCIDELND